MKFDWEKLLFWLVVAGVLCACYLTDPMTSGLWVWSGFAVVFCIVAVIAVVFQIVQYRRLKMAAKKTPMTLIPQLQRLWQRFATMGASDNDLHELIVVSQNMECQRIVGLLREIQQRAHSRDPSTAFLIGSIADSLERHEHRPQPAKPL